MRTHAEIIRDAGGWRALRERLGLPEESGKVKFWFFRDSIPAEYWKTICDFGMTTPEELILAAHRKGYLKAARKNPSASPKRGRPRKEAVAA